MAIQSHARLGAAWDPDLPWPRVDSPFPYFQISRREARINCVPAVTDVLVTKMSTMHAHVTNIYIHNRARDVR